MSHAPGLAPTPTGSRTATRPTAAEWQRLAALVCGLAIAVALMLLAFVGPVVNSGAHELPLAISGPTESVQQVTGALAARSSDTFDVTTYPAGQDVVDAIHDREAIGGVVIDGRNATVYTAGGAGAPYGAVVRGLGRQLAATGMTVAYTDLAPLTADDPTGAGMGVLGLPLVFGGMFSAVLFSNLLRHRAGMRALGSILFSAVAGMVVAAILQYWIGSIDGRYWETAGVLALGIAATSLTILGLESLLGPVGLGIGAVVMMFFANPLSGLASGPWWLPSPWGTIGQLFPPGATGTAVRSAAYFDGGGIAGAAITLGLWVCFGLALIALSVVRKRKAAAARGRHAAGASAPGEGATAQFTQEASADTDAERGAPQELMAERVPAMSAAGDGSPRATEVTGTRVLPAIPAAERGTGLYGQVTSAGRPVPDARLTVVDGSGAEAARTRSGADGGYRVGVAGPGTYLLIASADGFAPLVDQVPLTGTDTRHDVLIPGGTELDGEVISRDGRPLARTTVAVTDEDGHIVATTVTGPDGHFRLPGLGAGRHVVTAIGRTPAAVEIYLDEADEIATCRIVID